MQGQKNYFSNSEIILSLPMSQDIIAMKLLDQ